MDLKEHIINQSDLFIKGWYISSTICDDLIKYFENYPHKNPGAIYLPDGSMGQNKTHKISTDIPVPPSMHNPDHPPIFNYSRELTKVVNLYFKKFPMAKDSQAPGLGITEGWNIQRYLPKEGYFSYHQERGGIPSMLRYLVFTTYLNDVKEDGETEFFHQKLKIKPEQGATFIFPADWTYTHRGITAPTETKYISTGWISFLLNETQGKMWNQFQSSKK